MIQDLNKLQFLSTPSGWRATLIAVLVLIVTKGISIHALRVEGDKQIADALAAAEDFYPRPPGGGRLAAASTASM